MPPVRICHRVSLHTDPESIMVWSLRRSEVVWVRQRLTNLVHGWPTISQFRFVFIYLESFGKVIFGIWYELVKLWSTKGREMCFENSKSWFFARTILAFFTIIKIIIRKCIQFVCKKVAACLGMAHHLDSLHCGWQQVCVGSLECKWEGSKICFRWK